MIMARLNKNDLKRMIVSPQAKLMIEALYERIKHCPLFAGLDFAQSLFLMEHLHASNAFFDKGSVIFSQENDTDAIAH